jgi:hypothetical protein
MKTDDICVRYADEAVGLVLRLLEDDEDGDRTVLVEGRAKALRMLGELLIAVADGNSGESFCVSPRGPGKVHFDAKSELGIYIHLV